MLSTYMERLPLRKEAALSRLDCRLSIAKVRNEPVHTKWAQVRLTGAQAGAMTFETSLKLPVHVPMTYHLDLIAGGQKIRLTGERLLQAEDDPSRGIHRYRMAYTLQEAQRPVLYAVLNEYAAEYAKCLQAYEQPELQAAFRSGIDLHC